MASSLLESLLGGYGDRAVAATLPLAYLNQIVSSVASDTQKPGWFEGATTNAVNQLTPPSDMNELPSWGMQFMGPVKNIGLPPGGLSQGARAPIEELGARFKALMEAGGSQNKNLLNEMRVLTESQQKAQMAAEAQFLQDRGWKAKLNNLKDAFESKRLF